MAMIERLVDQAGATLASTDVRMGEATPVDVFTQTVLDAVGQLERANIAARTRRVMQTKKAKGEQIGGVAPFGWRHVEGMAVKHPAEQAALKLICRWGRQGFSVANIIQRLTDADHKPRGTKWHRNTVRRIIAANS